MVKHLLKYEYPNVKKADYEKAISFIDGKCSQYYFLDYMRSTSGNVDDAIEFYLLDDKLRCLLTLYLIRFEVQIKTDFVFSVQSLTHCSSFWKKRKYYLPDARIKRTKGRTSKYYLVRKKIKNNISRLSFATMGPSNYVAMYSSSFGTAQELFKFIDAPYKKAFIQKYTSCLERHDYYVLNSFLEAIRRIRNRCAHGNHVITLKMVNDLNNLRGTINKTSLKCEIHLTVMEAVLIYLCKELNCGKEFQQRIVSILNKHSKLLKKYNGKHSLSANSAKKLIDNYEKMTILNTDEQ